MFEESPLAVLIDQFTPDNFNLAGIEQRYLSDKSIDPRKFRHYAAVDTPGTRVGFFLPVDEFQKEVNSAVRKLNKIGITELALLKPLLAPARAAIHLSGLLSLYPTNKLFINVGGLHFIKPMIRLVLGFQPHVTSPKDLHNPFNIPNTKHRELGQVECNLDDCIRQFKLQLEYRNLLDIPFSERECRAIKQALEIAVKAHFKDKRKNGEPYAIHPIECATMLLKLPSAQAPWIIACLLHDVGEDTDYFGAIRPGARGFEEIVRRKLHLEFKDLLNPNAIDSIATTFLAVTRFDVDEQGQALDKQLARKNAMDKGKRDPGACFIRLVDRLHNTETIDVRRPEKIIEITNETKQTLLTWPKKMRRDYHILTAALSHETDLAIDLARARLGVK